MRFHLLSIHSVYSAKERNTRHKECFRKKMRKTDDFLEMLGYIALTFLIKLILRKLL